MDTGLTLEQKLQRIIFVVICFIAVINYLLK